MPETPTGNPPSLKVVKLEEAAQLVKKNGRPKKRTVPPIPQAILDGMTELEQEHFNYFLESYRTQFPDLTDADQITLMLAAMEYVNTLRVMADQLTTGRVISMARQHPGVQMRAYLADLSVTRKQRKTDGKSEESEARDWLTNLSKGS